MLNHQIDSDIIDSIIRHIWDLVNYWNTYEENKSEPTTKRFNGLQLIKPIPILSNPWFSFYDHLDDLLNP
jgi:hypothetical protein